MDMVDILGGLLSRKSGGGSSGGRILKEILTGGSGGASRSSSSAADGPETFPRIGPAPGDDEPEYSSLDDFLKNAHAGSRNASASRRSATPANRPQAPTAKPSVPAPSNRPTAPIAPAQPTGHMQRPQPKPRPPVFPDSGLDPSARAEILVRAMINAAKSDGQIDQTEQDAIVKQCGELTQDDIRWLQSEFATPLNIPEFAWSVPLGMEQEVYAISLMAMNLDNNAEATYLKDLAHGFRMTLADCNRIHQQYGAPQIR